jgi:hypothetical protein
LDRRFSSKELALGILGLMNIHVMGNLIVPESELNRRAAEQIAVHTFFASAAATRPRFGALEATLEEAEVKRSLAAGAHNVVLAIDSSKLDAPGVAVGLDWDRIDTLVTELDPAEVALQYKQLWTVEQWFRSSKTLLQTRPIYHRCDETIRGHVFCSFLALVLRQELQSRLEGRGHKLEWADVIADLERLQMVEVDQDGKRFLLRSEVQGTCGKVFQTVGVALPPTVQQVTPTTPGEDVAHSHGFL